MDAPDSLPVHTCASLQLSHHQFNHPPDAQLTAMGLRASEQQGIWAFPSSGSSSDRLDTHLDHWLRPNVHLIQQLKAIYVGVSIKLGSHIWNAPGGSLSAQSIHQLAALDADLTLYFHPHGVIEYDAPDCTAVQPPGFPNLSAEHTASLRIFSPEIDPTQVTQHLGIMPDRQHQKGDYPKNNPRYSAYKHGMWTLKSHLPREAPLQDHVQSLCDRLLPVRSKVSAYQQHTTVDFFCGLFDNDTVELPASVLHDIAVLGAGFGVDVYT